MKNLSSDYNLYHMGQKIIFMKKMGVELSDIISAVVSMKTLSKTIITSVQYNICLFDTKYKFLC